MLLLLDVGTKESQRISSEDLALARSPGLDGGHSVCTQQVSNVQCLMLLLACSSTYTGTNPLYSSPKY